MTDFLYKFAFEPFVGPIPLKFGMAKSEVIEVFEGREPDRSEPPNTYGGASDHYGDIGINYDENGLAAEFCFGESEEFQVYFNGVVLIGKDGVKNPIAVLKEVDDAPSDKLGFLIFNEIGVNSTGFHDNDPSQRAINFYKKGYWDEQIA